MSRFKKVKFTDPKIKKIQPEDKRFEVWEVGRAGFGLRISPTGRKTFIFLYRYNDKPRRMTLGEYPTLSLADAHTEHALACQKLKKGIDPGAVEQEERKRIRLAPTVNDLVSEYLQAGTTKKGKSLSSKTLAEYKRQLEKDIAPTLGEIKVADVTKRDIILAIGSVEKRKVGQERKATNAARQLYKITKRLFNFAVEQGMIPASPMHGIRVMGTEGEKDRNLSEEEIRTFWYGVPSADISEDLQRALKLVLITGQRPGEVIGAHADEFEGDWWTIPAARSKNKKAHSVFITPLAAEFFNKEKGGFLFPSPWAIVENGITIEKPIQVNAMSKALRRSLTGKEKGDEVPAPSLDMKPFTPHDLRRTAATQMAKIGFGVIVDKVLNHTDRRVTARYDHHDYAKEKQAALEAWSRRLENILNEKETDNVIPITKQRA